MERPRLVLVSGHMIDEPGRRTVRFPPTEEERVTAAVSRALADWNVGPGTLVISGGARGADLIASEQGLDRGADVMICLAQEPETFVTRSVALPDTQWASRFEAVKARAEVRVLPDDGRAATESIHGATNRWMIDIAGQLAQPDDRRVLLVWNGQLEDGNGGTGDFARLIARLELDGLPRNAPPLTDDPRFAVIDPTPRAYEKRQTQGNEPKRLLALDGGGIRGMISLQVLAEIERQLRERTGDPHYRLVDYFDYIGGTSTGAIVAAALAGGDLSAKELSSLYEELGEQIFAKRFLPMRFFALYRHGPLGRKLRDILGPDRTLGDPNLESLLLLVLHNTKTDSVWPLSNNTGAKYNRANRYLLDEPDRNLDLPLDRLIRGSAAAPVYFMPETLDIGGQTMVFQDGGITPFNNPALLLYLMATNPAYNLCWRAGSENLLIVSIGTGFSAAVHPRLGPWRANLLFNLKNLPSVFMNGASMGQDLLCRAVGLCRYGPPIDSEFGDQVRAPASGAGGADPAFSYVRYDADLSDAALGQLGIHDERQRRRLRALDSVKDIDALKAIGVDLASEVDVTGHFAGFLP